MPETSAIAVVGGGVVGLACAVNLRRAGASVIVFDEGAAPSAASSGNAGHIATEQVEPLASPGSIRSLLGRLFLFDGPVDFMPSDITAWAPWALRYLQASAPKRFVAGRIALGRLMDDAMSAWRRLVDSIGEPELLQENGHLVLWESERSARLRLAAWSSTDPRAVRFELLDADGVAETVGRIKHPLAGGLRFSGTGQVSDPDRLLGALRRSLMSAGGKIQPDRATGLSVVDGRAALMLEKAGLTHWDQIVVAAGVRSGGLMRGAGHSAPIIAERGYHVEGPVGHWGDLPPIVFEDRSIIVTRFGDRLRAAGFVEFGRVNTPPDPRKWARLRRHVQELGLPMRKPFSHWMGSRPTFPDYLPAIGVSSRADNLIYAFGHQHLGLTLAATTGEIIADLAARRPTALSLAAFDLSRFDRRPASKGSRDFAA